MRTRSKLLLAVLLLAVAGVAGSYTWSAFRATSANSGNSIASGTVSLSDNDAGGTLLALTGVQPGASDAGCIKVTYAGTLASNVRLYGTTSGSGLATYLDLKVTRGSYTPSDPGFDSCTNFQPDATNYIGSGAGVVYDGTLQAFADNWAGGLVDPTAGSPESWTTGESHVYRLEVSLSNNTAAQGLTAGQTFTWEARNQ